MFRVFRLFVALATLGEGAHERAQTTRCWLAHLELMAADNLGLSELSMELARSVGDHLRTRLTIRVRESARAHRLGTGFRSLWYREELPWQIYQQQPTESDVEN